jgi:hypothetical protein
MQLGKRMMKSCHVSAREALTHLPIDRPPMERGSIDGAMAELPCAASGPLRRRCSLLQLLLLLLLLNVTCQKAFC